MPLLRVSIGRCSPSFKANFKVAAPPKRALVKDKTATPKWERALPQGVLPAYDEALKLIHEDARRLRRESVALKAKVDATYESASTLEGDDKAHKLQELEELRKLRRIVQVQSQVNLPSVRWAVKNGYHKMGNVAHRHLIEQRWRGDGKLDLLMERMHQMKVIPDVVADLRPSIDMTLTVRAPGKVRPITIEPGSFVESRLTASPPAVYTTVFHEDTRLYTLLMVDPDVPDEVNETYTTYLHWLKPNVPLSAFTRGPLRGLNTHTAYVPPHPQEGTKYHRYTLLMLPQPPLTEYSLNVEAESLEPTSRYLAIPQVTPEERNDFDVRGFMKIWELDGRKGGGAHMWRAVWDANVNQLYVKLFGGEAPKFGKPRRADPYEEAKQRKKYMSV